MPPINSTAKSAADRVWGRLIELLVKQGKKKAAYWNMLRSEQCIKAYSDQRLVEHTAEQVIGYLKNPG